MQRLGYLPRPRRIARYLVGLSLAGCAAALVLDALEASSAVDHVRTVFVAGSRPTDLGTFDAARIAAALESIAAVVLAVLIVFVTRRILFALSAAWSLVALSTLAWIIAPTLARMDLYDMSPVGAGLAVIAAAVLAVACLAGSLVGWVVTPLGWDWLSAAPRPDVPPAPTRSLL